jgi:hypothetical protein
MLFVDDLPHSSLPERLLQVDGAAALPAADMLHHVMQRAPAPLAPVVPGAPGDARRAAARAYVARLDGAEGAGAARARVLEVLGQEAPGAEEFTGVVRALAGACG